MTNQVTQEVAEEAALMEAVAFVGSALAPFFLNDPRTGDAADSFAALAELDAAAAAEIGRAHV